MKWEAFLVAGWGRRGCFFCGWWERTDAVKTAGVRVWLMWWLCGAVGAELRFGLCGD